MTERPAAGGALSVTTGLKITSSIPPLDDAENERGQRDASPSRVTPKTPAERAREYRKRKRHALTEALVTPATVTPVTPNLTIQPVTPAVGMTKGERDELAKITRQRGRVAKARVETVKAELLADIEAKLSAEFSHQDQMWLDAVKIAQKAMADANAVIAQKSRERGHPADFAPSLQMRWNARGPNADPARRAELRKLAQARVDYIAKAAKLEIEAQESDVLAQLYAGGLTSDAARKFLEAMPDPRTLMPTVELDELGGPS